MSEQVPDEAVETACEAYETVRCNGKRASVRSGIAAALEAAAPFIRASALEDAASATDSTMEMIWLMDRAAAEREGGANRG